MRKMAEKKTKTETYEVSGEKLVQKVKELIKEGNVRRVTIKTKDGKELLSFPLTVGVTVGVVGVIVAPVLAAIGAIAALVAECTIVVEREE